MQRWFFILPGTRVQVKRGAGDFEPQTLERFLQFRQPTATTDTAMVVSQGGRQILVNRADVALSAYDGLRGTVQWGV